MTRILLLEDQPSIMKLMRLMLKPYSVIEATTAQEALLCSIDVDFQIDLLVADVTLPAGSGAAVARMLRSKIPTLPVILTSGSPVSSWRKQDSRELETLGAQSVQILQKPFQAQSFVHAVRESLRDSQPLISKIA